MAITHKCLAWPAPRRAGYSRITCSCGSSLSTFAGLRALLARPGVLKQRGVVSLEHRAVSLQRQAVSLEHRDVPLQRGSAPLEHRAVSLEHRAVPL
jgi:hypothetical protein